MAFDTRFVLMRAPQREWGSDCHARGGSHMHTFQECGTTLLVFFFLAYAGIV